MGKEVILFVDELESSSEIPLCRICLDAEFESCKSLEAPCSCSGTVKFAHRACIQRWCDEKGNTICEICLKNFKPGYTASVKKAQLLDAAVTLRGSLEVPRRERELENQESDATDEEQQLEYECSLAAERRANCCRFVALTFTVVLLVGHLLALLTGGTEDYPFTLLTLLIAKTGGIVLPMYILIRIIASIQNSTRRHYEGAEDQEVLSSESEEEEEEHQLHRVEIQSS